MNGILDTAKSSLLFAYERNEPYRPRTAGYNGGGVKVINAADERMPTEEDILLEKFSKLEIWIKERTKEP